MVRTLQQLFTIQCVSLDSKFKLKILKSVCKASNANFSVFRFRWFIFGTLIVYSVYINSRFWIADMALDAKVNDKNIYILSILFSDSF